MKTYVFEAACALFQIRSDAIISRKFLEILQTMTGKNVSAVYTTQVFDSPLPFLTTLPKQKTFADYIQILSAYTKQLFSCLEDEKDMPRNQLLLYKSALGHGAINTTEDEKLLLESQVFAKALDITIKKSWEIQENQFVNQWLEFYKGTHFESAEELQALIEVLIPPTKVPVLQGIAKELAVLKTLNLVYICPASYDGEWNSAEMSIVHAMRSPGLADIAKLKLVQAVLVKEFLAATKFESPPRTSDITNQFLAAVKQKYGLDLPLTEIGTHLKYLGYTNKRTAQGYIWPELAAEQRPKPNTIIQDSELFVGSAELYSGL